MTLDELQTLLELLRTDRLSEAEREALAALVNERAELMERVAQLLRDQTC